MRKKGINSKQKGSAFENEICKILSAWWGCKFHRVPASGGLHWKNVDSICGDVTCEDKLFPFSIECKKQEGWNFDQVVKGTGDVYNYWEQCISDANEYNKVPFLVFSKNQHPKYFLMYKYDFELLTGGLHNTMNIVEVSRHDLRHFGATVTIGFLDQLLANVSKEAVLSAFS